MILSFKLQMPNNNSWNGKWTGEKRNYVRVINFGRSKKAQEDAQRILGKGYYYYNFGDGWGAGISIEEVDSAKARKLRAKSDGFCGYDWMIESIKGHNEIRV